MSLELQSLLPYPNSCLGASPHQQGRDTKMEMLSFGGIDVSKDRLDITVLPDEQCSSVSNDAARQIRRLGALKKPSCINAGFAILVSDIVTIGHKPASLCIFARRIDCRNGNPCSESRDLSVSAGEKGIILNQDRAEFLANDRCASGIDLRSSARLA